MINKLAAVIAIIGLLVIPQVTKANDRPEHAITITKISEQVYVLKPVRGMGSNVGVVVADDGLLLIDAMNIQPGVDKFLAKTLKKISDKPVKFIINTHSHRDHTGANKYFSEKGATIISQENVKFAKFDGPNPLLYPNQWLVNKKLTMTFGGEPIVAHAAVSHTYNDLIVYLPKSNLVFMGDNMGTSWGPNNSEQSPVVLNKVLSNINQDTKVVPGHGYITTKQHLKHYTVNTVKWFSVINQFNKKQLTPTQIIKEPEFIQLVDFFTGNVDKAFGEDLKHTKRRIKRTIDQFPHKTYDTKNYKNYLGKHSLTNEQSIEIIARDNFLYARIDNDFVAELSPTSATRFDFVGWDNGEHISFALNNDNTVNRVKLHKPEPKE